MLTRDGFAESDRNETAGLFHIDAEDWDAETFLIYLQILHLRNRQVPRIVTLEIMAKMAILVDYYDCGEAVKLLSCSSRCGSSI